MLPILAHVQNCCMVYANFIADVILTLVSIQHWYLLCFLCEFLLLKVIVLILVKRLDTKKLVLAIIIALVVTQVANICIYGVVKYRGAETNCKNKQSVKKDDENEDRQEYEVFPTTESHYTGLQLEARKEIVYADLSPPTVNNYSEIGTERRSKQF
ncbi:uncharacterized protein LOC130635416 [Hydractinia symbiolongicarpus]|uniref:uncharacterized protein LOC130635416 n=1 Tax=Hydractinia symbiolongicarpus TaxID=13093 RepID=UPI00254CD438|nr:uncharacterized protein LOC130635416 [Hydractinia symbiolongicarpus]